MGGSTEKEEPHLDGLTLDTVRELLNAVDSLDDESIISITIAKSIAKAVNLLTNKFDNAESLFTVEEYAEAGISLLNAKDFLSSSYSGNIDGALLVIFEMIQEKQKSEKEGD